MMNDFYGLPSLLLLCVLGLVFASLHRRTRTPRSMLWLIAWCFAILHLFLGLVRPGWLGIGPALNNISFLLAAVMFLGSMSPLSFGRSRKLLYVFASAIPLLLFAALVSIFPSPGIVLRSLILAAVATALLICLFWSVRPSLLPAWFTVTFTCLVGGMSLYFAWKHQYCVTLGMIRSSSNFITALLFLLSYRRLSPGVVFTVCGFLLWMFPISPGAGIAEHTTLASFVRFAGLGPIIAAVGMIVLLLEDELARNDQTTLREQRARREMEAYTQLDLSSLGAASSGIYDHICAAVAERSRFAQVLLLLRSPDQNFYLAGRAGMGEPSLRPYEALLVSMPGADLERILEQASPISCDSSVGCLPLDALASALSRAGRHASHSRNDSRFNGPDGNLCVVPIEATKISLQGALLLSGLKDGGGELVGDDFLAVEILAGRILAASQHGNLISHLVRSEKLAGLGQLAGGVAHELNNPLTVVMGYAELIEDSATDQRIRRNAAIIRSESHRMKEIIESLLRFWRPSPVGHVEVSLVELLEDISRLRKYQLELSNIELTVSMSPNLPMIRANADQLKRVFLQLLNNATDAVATNPPGEPRRIRIDASYEAQCVHVLVSDSGPGVPEPNRVFDPFFTTKAPGEGPGLGLSLCYSIVREHGGEISAVNLHPRGAAVVMDFPVSYLSAPGSSVAGSPAIG